MLTPLSTKHNCRPELEIPDLSPPLFSTNVSIPLNAEKYALNPPADKLEPVRGGGSNTHAGCAVHVILYAGQLTTYFHFRLFINYLIVAVINSLIPIPNGVIHPE